MCERLSVVPKALVRQGDVRAGIRSTPAAESVRFMKQRHGLLEAMPAFVLVWCCRLLNRARVARNRERLDRHHGSRRRRVLPDRALLVGGEGADAGRTS